MSKGFMYILECSDGSYYIGSTKDLEKRLNEHQNGEGANHTKKHLPVKLLYYEEFTRIDDAFYREKQVQGWSRNKKEALMKGDFGRLSHLSRNYTQYGTSTGSAPFSAGSVSDSEVTTSGGENNTKAASTSSASTKENKTKVVELAETTGQKQLIPKLRFVEFSNKYEKLEFSEIANRGKKTYNPNKDLTNYQCVELESLSQVTGQLIKTFDSIELKSNKTKFSVNEVLFGKLRPYLKKYWLTEFEGVCTSEIWVLKGKAVINPYLYYLIQTNKFNYEANITTGSKMPRADWDSVSSVKYSIPNKEEQQKIATFLTAVDTKISQLNKKKALLEQYKKGIMQKIFNQELRFKDDNGNDYPDWETKKLGQISTINMGQSPSSNSYNSDGVGKYLVQGNADIKNRKTNPRNWTTEPTKLCEIGDLILTVRAPVGTIAKSIHNACIGRGVCSIKNNSKSNIEFLYQFLLDFEISWTSLEQGSTFTAVSGKDIKSIEINLPSIKEQTKIANFLSAIDAKINHVNNQLEQTNTFKKGLLQQMFV